MNADLHAKLDALADEFSRADNAEDEYGDPIPGEVLFELRERKREAASEERAEIERRRNR